MRGFEEERREMAAMVQGLVGPVLADQERAEMAFVAERLDQEGKPFTAGCVRRLLGESAMLIRERDEAREQVRSLTVERDALKGSLSKSEYWLRTVRETREAEQAERRDARDRLSRAREALGQFDASGRHSLDWRAFDALRAALSEPPSGGP